MPVQGIQHSIQLGIVSCLVNCSRCIEYSRRLLALLMSYAGIHFCVCDASMLTPSSTEGLRFGIPHINRFNIAIYYWFVFHYTALSIFFWTPYLP